MTVVTPIDHLELAESRIATQFRESENFINYIGALLVEADTLEEVFFEILTERFLDTAIGVQLDIIGVIVGQDRGDLSDDDDYRLFIRARIIKNSTSSTPEDIISQINFILDVPLVIFIDGDTKYEVFIGRALTPSEKSFIASDLIPKTAGVLASYVAEFDVNDFFSFLGIPGGSGFGSIAMPSLGGKLANLIF